MFVRDVGDANLESGVLIKTQFGTCVSHEMWAAPDPNYQGFRWFDSEGRRCTTFLHVDDQVVLLPSDFDSELFMHLTASEQRQLRMCLPAKGNIAASQQDRGQPWRIYWVDKDLQDHDIAELSSGTSTDLSDEEWATLLYYAPTIAVEALMKLAKLRSEKANQ